MRNKSIDKLSDLHRKRYANRMPNPPDHVFLPLPIGSRAEPIARAWLAAHWRISAEAVPLRRDARSRPRLIAPLADHDVNWSHSGGLLLIACARGLHIGCDLERIRPRPNHLAIARRFFHPREAGLLERLPSADAEHLFLRIWCAKEAVLKAHGHGIAFGLEKLRFEDGEAGLSLAECDPRLGRAGDWRIRELPMTEGHLATLAWLPHAAMPTVPAILAP